MISFASLTIVAIVASLLPIQSLAQPPTLVPAITNHLETRLTTGFSSSCKDISYYGYCRLEANCTMDGSTVGTNVHAQYQHTFLDLGQCIKYEDKQLKWRYKSASHYQSTYCAPCSQCTLDPKTTLMDCKCQYTDTNENHKSQLRLSDRVWNRNGVLGCMDITGDIDSHP